MWDAYEEMKRLQKEMNKLFNTFFGQSSSRPSKFSSTKLFREPLIDIRDTGKELIASIEIPGVDKNDIKLSVTDSSLELRVNKKHETKIAKQGYIHDERSYKGFYRSMTLPESVVPEKTKATYTNGILEVIMPKAKKKAKTKRIKVN